MGAVTNDSPVDTHDCLAVTVNVLRTLSAQTDGADEQVLREAARALDPLADGRAGAPVNGALGDDHDCLTMGANVLRTLSAQTDGADEQALREAARALDAASQADRDTTAEVPRFRHVFLGTSASFQWGTVCSVVTDSALEPDGDIEYLGCYRTTDPAGALDGDGLPIGDDHGFWAAPTGR